MTACDWCYRGARHVVAIGGRPSATTVGIDCGCFDSIVEASSLREAAA